MCQNFSPIQQLLPKLSTILYMAASFKTIPIQYHCVANCIKINSYEHFFQDHFDLVYFQHNGRTAHIPTTHIPLALRGPADMAFEEWQSHVTLVHWKHPISPERDGMPASLVSWAQKASSDWQHLKISKDVEQRKTPENVFTTFANTLEVSTSQWNYINEMYSDIWQGEQETTDQLNQCIKILVKKCGYASTKEKTRC